MKASNREAIEDQVSADLRHHLAGRVHAVRRGRGRCCRRRRRRRDRQRTSAPTSPRSRRRLDYVTGIDARTILQIYDFRLEGRLRRRRSPNLGARRRRRRLRTFAEDHDIAVGDTISVLTPSGTTTTRTASAASTSRRPFYPLLGGVEHLEGDLRRALRPPAEPVHVRERRRATRPTRQPAARGARSPASPTRRCRRGRSGSTSRTRISTSS